MNKLGYVYELVLDYNRIYDKKYIKQFQHDLKIAYNKNIDTLKNVLSEEEIKYFYNTPSIYEDGLWGFRSEGFYRLYIESENKLAHLKKFDSNIDLKENEQLKKENERLKKENNWLKGLVENLMFLLKK